MGIRRIARAFALGAATIAFAGTAQAQFQRIEWLDQGWSDTQRNQFYTTSQGSRLLPFVWFVNLERKDSTALFIDDGLARYGYLAQPKSRGNENGLPVGFVTDPARDLTWIGLNCSACHTNRMTVKGRTFQIDGAPGGGDLQSFLEDLVAAMTATLNDPAKYARFAARVEPLLPEAQRPTLRRQFGAQTRQMADFMSASFAQSQGPTRWGPMRTDAFGMIFNRLAGLDLGIPANLKAANAPVSYPFLWTTNRQTIVQWPGLVPDNENALVRWGRNVGQVVGVFGTVPDLGTPGVSEEKRFAASIRVWGLARLGHLIGSDLLLNFDTLTAPRWPSDKRLGAEFAINVPLARTGQDIYQREGCVNCHAPLGGRFGKIESKMFDVNRLGTDPLTATNALRRSLPGALAPYVTVDATGTVPTAALLKAAVTRIILFNLGGPQASGALDTAAIAADGRPPPTSAALREAVRAAAADPAAPAAFSQQSCQTPTCYKGGPLAGIWATSPYLHNGSVPDLEALFLPSRCNDPAKPDECRPATFQVGNREFDPAKVGYRRDSAPGSWTYDTAQPGNRNTGHEGPGYGTTLNPDERKALIEYLKVIELPGFEPRQP